MICQHSLIPNSSENLCDHILDTSGTDSKEVTLLFFSDHILYSLFCTAHIYHYDYKLWKVTVVETLNKLQTPGKRLFEAEFIIHTAVETALWSQTRMVSKDGRCLTYDLDKLMDKGNSTAHHVALYLPVQLILKPFLPKDITTNRHLPYAVPICL